MATNSTSFTNTPQASDDAYSFDEDFLLNSNIYNATTNVLTLDVMSDDLGGKAKQLFSISSQDGTDQADLWSALKSSDVGANWETTTSGNLIRIANGKIEYQITDLGPSGLNSLSADQSINDTFTYAIRLGNGTLSWATVTVEITGTNDGPTNIFLSNASIAENAEGAVIGVLSTEDVDNGDTHTYTVSDSRFEVVNGELKLKAGESLDFESEQSVSINVTSTDNHNASFTKAFTIDVGDVNEAPDAGDNVSATVAEDVAAGTVLASVAASDPDAGGGNDSENNFENLSYAITAGNDDGLFEIDADGNVTLASGKQLDFETASQHVLTVTVTDGGSLSDTTQVTIDVSDVNEAPDAGDNVSATVAEDVAAGGTLASVTATDPDVGGGNDNDNNFENLSYAITAGNDDGLFEIDADGNVLLASGQQLDYESATQHVLTVTVTDGGNLADTTQVTINVSDVNEAPVNIDPVAVNDKWIISEGASFTITLAWLLANDSDADGGVLSVTDWSALPAWMTANTDINGNLESITVVNAALGDGTETFTYTISDGQGGESTATVNIAMKDILSGTGADSIDLSSEVEAYDFSYINTNNGTDTLVAGAGSDKLIGGAGVDTIKITAPTTDSVDGGENGNTNNLTDNTGDILVFNGTLDLTLDLTNVTGIETISMKDADGGAGADTLTLNLSDVLSLGTGTFNPDGPLVSADAIRVMGDSDDTLNVTGGGWSVATTTGTTSGDPIPAGFTLLAHDSDAAVAGIQADAYILYQSTILVNVA